MCLRFTHPPPADSKKSMFLTNREAKTRPPLTAVDSATLATSTLVLLPRLAAPPATVHLLCASTSFHTWRIRATRKWKNISFAQGKRHRAGSLCLPARGDPISEPALHHFQRAGHWSTGSLGLARLVPCRYRRASWSLTVPEKLRPLR